MANDTQSLARRIAEKLINRFPESDLRTGGTFVRAEFEQIIAAELETVRDALNRLAVTNLREPQMSLLNEALEALK